MSNVKEKADKIIEEHKEITSSILSDIGATKHAILSTENTIKVLEQLSSKFILNPTLEYAFDEIAFLIHEQKELLIELKNRLL